MHTYTETTQNIEVKVIPTYMPEDSDPTIPQFVFSYHVTITNHGTHAVTLLARHWIITDGNGHIEEVQGPGVIGEQPTINPGQSHSYKSFCPLMTPTGSMRGSYLMTGAVGADSATGAADAATRASAATRVNATTGDSAQFQVKIPLFFLRSDEFLH